MHFKLIFLFALISSTFAQLNYADNWFLSEESTNLTSLTEAIKDAEKFIVSLKDQLNLPSLVSGVSIRGKTVWNNVWGYADLENQVSAKLSTKYRMCSITKSFTSALIGTMVDRGLLHYGDPLSKYVSDSDYPAKSWDHQPVNITIGQLLSHTGGARFTETTDVDDFVEAKNCTQAVHKFRNVPLKFKPGTNYIYSNYGYILLGAVIESITKRPFPVELAQFIDQKLRLNSSYVEMPDLVIKDRARYYQALDATKHVKVNIPTTTYDQMLGEEGYWPAGSVLSTVADMLVYGNLMIDSFKGRPNAVLSKKTITDMWTPKTSHLKLNFNSEFEYAYGWVIRHINATQQPHVRHRYIVWHNGGLAGASTMLYIYPEEEMVAVAMTNKGNVQPALEQMLIRMVENIYDFVK